MLREENSKLERSVSFSSIVAVISIFLVMLLWILWPLLSPFLATWAGAIDVGGKESSRTAAIGAWGDSFGGFNALFAALGFGGVATTVFLQYRSHEREKVERHMSRFEDNFFRLIDLMRNLREGLQFQSNVSDEKKSPYDELVSSQDLLSRFGSDYLTLIRRRIDLSAGLAGGVNGEDELGQIKQELQGGGRDYFVLKGHDAVRLAYYEVSYLIFKKSSGKIVTKQTVSQQYSISIRRKFEWCFSPYFRIIYTILRRISDDKVMDERSKAYYANLLRSQLTTYEIGLLAFNSTSKHSKDLHKLLVEFRMLKYFPENRRGVLGKIFPEEAFAARD